MVHGRYSMLDGRVGNRKKSTGEKMASQEDMLFAKIALSLGFINASQLSSCLKFQDEMAQSRQYLPISDCLLKKGMLDSSRVEQVKQTLVSHSRSSSSVPLPQTPDASSDRPLKFGRYSIVSEIGQGGMGKIYKVYDVRLDRHVALKMLISEGSEINVQRFLREAKASAQLKHPNIVPVYDVGSEEGRYFFTMDFIEGESLHALIRKGTLTIRQIVEIMIKVGDAIQYAHRQGIVHRDIKPGNIMIDVHQEPKIMDFGLAKVSKESQKLSQSGMIIGTAQYMPPEQAEGRINSIDERSDIYSLGALLYEMLTGRPPFWGNSFSQILYQVIHKDPIPPSTLKKNIPRGLENICLKAMEKRKSRRYQSAASWVDDLVRFQRGETVEAEKNIVWNKAIRKIKRNKGVSISAGLFFAFLIFMMAGISIWGEVQKRSRMELLRKEARKSLEQARSAESLEKKYEKDLRRHRNQSIPDGLRREIEHSLLHYLKAHSLLDRAFALESENLEVRKELYKIEKEMGLLGLLGRDYILSQIFFERCKRLGSKDEAEKLLESVERRRQSVQKDRSDRVNEIMEEVKKTPPDKGMLEEYITEILKMSGRETTLVLLGHLRSGEFWQRRIAIDALGKLGDTYTTLDGKDPCEWLIERLKKIDVEKNAEEAELLIWALGRLRDPRANRATHDARWKAGQNSALWAKTNIPYGWIPMSDEEAGMGMLTAKEYFERGVMKFQKGDLNGAWSDFTDAVKRDSRYAQAYNARGNVHLVKGNLDEAIAEYTQAIRVDPNYSNGYANRGNARLQKEDLDGAIADYTQAISMEPKDASVYNNRGMAYQFKGEIQKAIQDYHSAIALLPNDFEAYNKLGAVHMEIGELRKAVLYYSRSIEINPYKASVYNNRAIARDRMGDWEGAIVDLNHSIGLSPREPGSYVNRGMIQASKGRLENAISDYNQAISLDPTGASAYFHRGNAYEKQKNLEQALSDYTKAISHRKSVV